MSNAIAWFLATLVTLPILGFYLIYIITVKTTKHKKNSFRLAVDVSTLLFIIAVYFLIYEIWSLSLLWMMIGLILLIAIIFTVVHWKLFEDIQLKKLVKGIWRFNFLLFFIAYVVLSVYGIISRIFSFI